MVYVTSQPVHPLILEYYFQLLVGIPASHARSRLTLLCAYDASPRSLTEKILAAASADPADSLRHRRPVARLHDRLQLDAARAQAFRPPRHPVERSRSGAAPPRHEVGKPQDVSRGGRRRARRASRTCGLEDDVVAALDGAAAPPPAIRRAVLKLDDSFSGEGNAVFRYPEAPGRRHPARGARPTSPFAVAQPTRDRYLREVHGDGGIVEELLEYPGAGVPERAASDRSAGRGRASLDARPDSRRAQRPGLPGMPVPGGASLPARRSRMRDAASGRSSPATAWSAVSASTSSSAGAPGRPSRDLRPRDQPAHRRDDAPVPRAPVSDGRPLDPGSGAFRLAARLAEVLPLDR